MWFAIGFTAACLIGVYLVSGSWLLLLSCVALAAMIGALSVGSVRARKLACVLLGCFVGLLWLFGFDKLYLQPVRQMDGQAVILNIEPDHLDYFSGLPQILDSFEAYAKKADTLIVNADDANVGEVCRRLSGCRMISFSASTDADYRAENIALAEGFPTFDVIERGRFLFRAELSVFGRHNVYNALAAIAAARLCGLAPEGIAAGLKNYRGAARRMQYMGRFNGARLFSDYAHHPTELRATLEGLREAVEGRLIAVFQPHTYSRTATLFDEFAHSFGVSDEVIITDIYAAREVNTYGVSEEALARAIGEKALYIKGFEAVAEHLKSSVTKDDTLILLGAGDVEKLIPLLSPLDK